MSSLMRLLLFRKRREGGDGGVSLVDIAVIVGRSFQEQAV